MSEVNYKLLIQYDGRPFQGWQRQKSGSTIQGCIEDCIERIWNRKITLYGSGRTDAGVHARGQVANFIAEKKLDTKELQLALNAELPLEIRIRSAQLVPESFHSQYSAVDKTYRYLLQSSALRSPFLPFYVHWSSFDYDLDAMRKAAKAYPGEHDYAAFMNSGSNISTTVRDVKEFEIGHNNGLFSFTVRANGFLRNMVRNMVGLLMDVGRGKVDPLEVRQILLSKDRKQAGYAAPATGLTLIKVRYK